ncbi:MAG: IS6 family transposase [Pseudomonadales bacterium]
MNPEVAKVLKRLHYPLEVMLTCVRWYVAYPLSLRHLEEMMAERGVSVDHSTVHRWALKLLPALNKIFRSHKRPVGKILLLAQRDKAAARRFFEKAIAQHGQPDTVTIDGSPANLAALHDINAEWETPIAIRQVKYLNNIVEQDHRAIKRMTRPMLGFKDFRCARILLGGIELMHMIAKGQMRRPGGATASAAQQFYSLAA